MKAHRFEDFKSIRYLFLVLITIGAVVSDKDDLAEPQNRKNRAINGISVEIEDFPYSVSLLRGQQNKLFCSANIIGRYHAITACHCVSHDLNPKNYLVRAGSNYWDKGGSLHDVILFACDPRAHKLGCQSCDDTYGYDLAILVVGTPFDLDNKTRRAIKLWKPNHQPWQHQLFHLVSWGRNQTDLVYPKQLQLSVFDYINPGNCIDSLHRFTETHHVPDIICAKPKNGQLCIGDSGSGLISNGQLVGICSWTRGSTCSSNMHVMFTNVLMSIDWLENFVQSSLSVINQAKTKNEQGKGLKNLKLVTNVDQILSDIHTTPHVVSILQNDWFLCTGSIISRSVIVSAAHCFPNNNTSNLMVRSGSSYWHTGGTLHKVSKVILHPKAMKVEEGWDYNVAVVKITDTFDFTVNTQQPVMLFYPIDFEEIYNPNLKVWMSGWENYDVIEYNSTARALMPSLRIQNIDVVAGSVNQCYYQNKERMKNFYKNFKSYVECTNAGLSTGNIFDRSSSGVIVGGKLFGILSKSFLINGQKIYQYTVTSSVSSWIEQNMDSFEYSLISN